MFEKVGLFEINMLYLRFVLRSVFEVCNFEFGPFYNYPFSVLLLAVSACVRSGPWHDHFLSSHYRNNWARRPRPGPVPVPLFAQFRHPARRHGAPRYLLLSTWPIIAK